LPRRYNQRRPTKRANCPPPSAKAIPENSGPNTNESPGSTKADQQASKESFDRSVLRWTKVVGVFTGVLAVVGIIQAWAFIQSERSFVYAYADSISPNQVTPDQPFQVTIAVRNDGKSEAFISDFNVTYLLTDKILPPTPSYQYPTAFAMNGPIVAGARYDGIMSPKVPNGLPAAFGSDMLALLKEGKESFYIFGWVKYSDAFTWFGDKTTGFCGNWRAVDNKFYDCGVSAYTYAR
jgi:hypothetical protein